MEIEHYSWQGQEGGPHLLISGGIHGNEICGPASIRWLKEQLDCGNIKVKQGSLTILPLCNPKAYEINKRYFEKDLNRNFYPKENPEIYEDKICNQISGYFEQADILLDIHSYHTQGDAFIFVRPDHELETEFAGMLGVSTYFYGFGDAYRKAGVSKSEKESMGTTEYTRLHNGYGVTMECGFHNDPKSIEFAKRAIIGALHHLGIATIGDALKPFIPEKHTVKSGNLYRMIEVFYKKKEGKLSDIQHLEQVTEGTFLAKYDDGTELVAPYDGYMIFPKPSSPIGEEWFYLAEKMS